MRFLSMKEFLGMANFNGWDNLTAWNQLSKGHILEGLLAMLLGMRVWYPYKDGLYFPDMVDRHGRYIQVKGLMSGMNWLGSIENTINSDFSNFYTIVSLNRGKLIIFLLTKEQMISYLNSHNKVWKVDGLRFRLQYKQNIAYLTKKENSHRMFTLKGSPYQLLERVQAYALKANTQNRIK